MLDCDVIAYHITDGRIKHIQSKSNGHYDKADTDALAFVRQVIQAPNVSVELWNWMDNLKYPIITVFNIDGTTATFTEDPQIKRLLQ